MESKRTTILASLVCLVVLGITVADFLDNGKIDNEKFLIVALFLFSGAGAGRALDSMLDKYLGDKKDKKGNGGD